MTDRNPPPGTVPDSDDERSDLQQESGGARMQSNAAKANPSPIH
jgi:hypothetical protein